MILSISFQLKIFLSSILIGFFIGFFYDFIVIFRKILVHNNLFISLEDALYWIIMSVLVFFLALYQNNGEIRMFFILGIFLGMIFYFLTISPIFLKLSDKIINILFNIIKILVKIILSPILILLKIFSIPIKFLLNIIKKLLQNNKLCVKIYNKLKIIKMKLKILFSKRTDIGE